MKTRLIAAITGRYELLALFCGLIITAGCGVAPQSGGNTSGNEQGSAMVQVRFGENTPVEKILSYELTVNQVTLTSAGSATTDLLSAPLVIEQSGLAATTTPIASVNVLADTYTRATVSLGASKIVFVDNLGHPHEQAFGAVSPVQVSFNPALTVGTTPQILTVSLDLERTVSVDSVHGTAQMNTPVFSVNSSDIAAGFQTADTGFFQCVYGKVTSVAGPRITVKDALTGVSLEFVTDGSTVIEDATLSTLPNMLVEIEGHTLSDGSLIADEVEAFQSSSGVLAAGIVAGNTDDPAKMTVTSNAVLSDGLPSSKLGTVITVDLSQTPTYATDTAGMDMTGLDGLKFDQDTIIPGQLVTFTSHTGLLPDPDGTSGLLVADTVELEPQTFTGTVTNYVPADIDAGTPATFDLQLPDDGSSMLSVLGSGATSLPVVVQSRTDLSGLPSGLSENMTVRVRGLLFYVDYMGAIAVGQGTLDHKLVAQRIVQ